MLLDAAEAVLGIFGFERTLRQTKRQEVVDAVTENRMLDMNTETKN
ncbi:MAG: hypothetical protein ABJB85_04730 [Nitrososphaerota archaeon]